MRKFARLAETILVLICASVLLSTPLPAQQKDHICCSSEDCRIRQVKPNLQLDTITHLFGSLVDETGAPFKLSKVELRMWISPTQQVVLKTVTTDNAGHFDLGDIEKGQYRFLPSSTGAFKQPGSLLCPQKECRLELVLQANPTDTLESICPIR
jgi:hypothetical protein